MIDDLDPKQVPGQLEAIERNAERLLTLVNDLLLVASDGRDLNVRDVDFSTILKRAVAAVAPEALAKGLQISVNTAESLPARLDPEQMLKVVKKLLSNAIKFSTDGGEIILAAGSAGSNLTCSIQDYGIGMDEKEQADAFLKFFRADRAMNTAVPGAGLGLPISKAIVERHGGSFSLTSAPGAGTKIEFRIPSNAVAAA